jgi:hypothetical protein
MQKEFKIKRASALFNPVADTPFKAAARVSSRLFHAYRDA